MRVKTFPAKLSQLRNILHFISSCTDSFSLSKVATEHILLAAEEAIVNIINYGYPCEVGATIEITCTEVPGKKGIKVVIKDRGIPFDPIKHLPHFPPSKVIMETQPNDTLGGYGIWILIKLMDRVEYSRLGNENILTLVKYTSDLDENK